MLTPGIYRIRSRISEVISLAKCTCPIWVLPMSCLTCLRTVTVTSSKVLLQRLSTSTAVVSFWVLTCCPATGTICNPHQMIKKQCCFLHFLHFIQLVRYTSCVSSYNKRVLPLYSAAVPTCSVTSGSG